MPNQLSYLLCLFNSLQFVHLFQCILDWPHVCQHYNMCTGADWPKQRINLNASTVNMYQMVGISMLCAILQSFIKHVVIVIYAFSQKKLYMPYWWSFVIFWTGDSFFNDNWDSVYWKNSLTQVLASYSKFRRTLLLSC